MLMGNNVDIDRRGKTVHIQTEDLGRRASRIMTQVFHSGAIVDSRTVSYAEELAKYECEEKKNEVLRKMMLALGRHFMKQIQAGVYDEKLGLPPISETESVAAERPPAVSGSNGAAAAAVSSRPPLAAAEANEAESSGDFGSTTGMGLTHQAGDISTQGVPMSDRLAAVSANSVTSSPSSAFVGVPDLARLDAATTADIRALLENR